MLPQLVDVCCASLPVNALPALAAVRVVPGVTVYQQGDRAWVRWENQEEDVLRRLLPIPGVILYCWREGVWYRLGESLPAFEVPVDAPFQPLYQLLFPAPVQPLPAPKEESWRPINLRLQPEHQPRPATALVASATAILAWAEQVPSFRLDQFRAAWNGAEVLVIGPRLPAVASGRRVWGKTLLLPLGFRLEPDVPESTIRAAFGLTRGELLLIDADGEQIIPRDVFEPLHRSGLRRLVGR
jgi:hypothetical protein